MEITTNYPPSKDINRVYQEERPATRTNKMIAKGNILGLDFLSSSRDYIIMEISLDKFN